MICPNDTCVSCNTTYYLYIDNNCYSDCNTTFGYYVTLNSYGANTCLSIKKKNLKKNYFFYY